MHVQAVRMIADWLAIAGNGVNALLPTVPRDLGDPQPANVTVVDESRTAWLTRKKIPKGIASGGPVLGVSVLDEATVLANPQLAIQNWTEGSLPIVVRYFGENVDSAEGYEAAGYTLRAAKGSLFLLERHENLSARERNGVRITRLEQMKIVPMKEEFEDVSVWGGLAVSLSLQDVIATPS